MTVRLEPGSIVLSPAEARMLYQIARIGELRNRYRIGDSAVYRLLSDISVAAFFTDAAPGTLPRQETASDEREYWTTQQLARATRRAPRTIRLACERRELPAKKRGGTWMIPAEHATTYIKATKETT